MSRLLFYPMAGLFAMLCLMQIQRGALGHAAIDSLLVGLFVALPKSFEALRP